LKLASEAIASNFSFTTEKIRSLTLVFPFDPATPMVTGEKSWR